MHTFSTHAPALSLIGIMLARARAAAERLYITSSGFGLQARDDELNLPHGSGLSALGALGGDPFSLPARPAQSTRAAS